MCNKELVSVVVNAVKCADFLMEHNIVERACDMQEKIILTNTCNIQNQSIYFAGHLLLTDCAILKRKYFPEELLSTLICCSSKSFYDQIVHYIWKNTRQV